MSRFIFHFFQSAIYLFPLKRITFILGLIISFQLLDTQLLSQSGYDIRVKIEGYHADSLWFGHTYGKRVIADKGVVRGADGWFHLHSNDPIAAGLHAIVYDRGGKLNYLSCWLTEDQRQFSIETNYYDITASSKVSGSNENMALFDYLKGYIPLKDEVSNLTQEWKSARDEPSFRKMVRKQEELYRFQQDFIQRRSKTLTADLVQQTLFVIPPVIGSNTWQEEADSRHLWMREHYFDYMDLGSGNFMKYPLWIDRTDYYFSVLPPPVPDSMLVMIEEVFDRLKPDPKAYHYYVGYVMNSLTRMSRHRADEVFVYLVRKYLNTGMWDFLTQDRIDRYQYDANRLEPLLVGKKSPDVTFYDPEGSPVTIYDTDAPFVLLLFWLYDCSHCKKEIPIVNKIYERFKSTGLKVMSVCGKSGINNASKCWDFAKEKEMPQEWLILNDPERRSGFNSKLNIRSYPRMILLNRDKQIIFKHTGVASKEELEREIFRAINITDQLH